MRMFRESPRNSKSPENIIFYPRQIEEIGRMLTELKRKLEESFGNPELLKQQKNFVYDAGDKVIELDDNEGEDTSNVLGEAKSIYQFERILNDTHFHLNRLCTYLEAIVGSITNNDLGEMLQNGTSAADDNRVRLFVLSLKIFNQDFLELFNQQANAELCQHKPSNCFIDRAINPLEPLAIDPLKPLEQLHQALYDYLQGEDAKYLESLVSASLANNCSSTDSPTLSPSTSNDSFSSGRTTPSSGRSTPSSPAIPTRAREVTTTFPPAVNQDDDSSDRDCGLTDDEDDDEQFFCEP